MAAYSEGAVIYLPASDRAVHVGHLCIVESADHALPILGVVHRSDRTDAYPVTPFDGAPVVLCTRIVRANRVLAIHVR
jgi:hypothetical protein